MLAIIKQKLYFPLAWYFRIFASIRLSRWRPRVFIITGSSGKTTCLHLVEAILKDKARYSHHANSAYGISFDILGFHHPAPTVFGWISLFLLTPFYAIKSVPIEKIYVAEVDCDRPYEGEFLGSFLRPELVMWGNVSRTHAANFEQVVRDGKFDTIENAIAYEFSRILKYCQKEIYINADSALINEQLKSNLQEVIKFEKKGHLNEYSINKTGTKFIIDEKTYKFPYLLPENVFYSIAMTIQLAHEFEIKDISFDNFVMPPGRSSILPGIKNTALIDSSYNSNLDSATAIIEMFGKLEEAHKWVVLGDMLEQGEGEKEEHKKLAKQISKIKLDRIILVGSRVTKFAYPKLQKLFNNTNQVVCFNSPKEALDYLQTEIIGGETILFKASQTGFYFEGIIESLLLNNTDINKLCRREKVFEIARRKLYS